MLNIFRRTWETCVAAGLVICGSLFGQTMPKAAYDFSLPREERIKLAESAAPLEISGKATVYLLERSGYVKVREGSNGFSCFVDRQTPFNQEPTCFDAEGSATTLVIRLYVEEQRGLGKTEEQIAAAIEAGYKAGKFRAPQKPGIVYMMSNNGYLLIPGKTELIHIPAHLMFYAPYATSFGEYAAGHSRRPAGCVHYRDSRAGRGEELSCPRSKRPLPFQRSSVGAALAERGSRNFG